jgi:hypothetical protein
MFNTSVAGAAERFATVRDDDALSATVVALEERGFGVEVVGDRDAACVAVLARIPDGATVMSNTSVTLEETGIAHAINEGGTYDSARNKVLALDFEIHGQETDRIAGPQRTRSGSASC